MGRGTVSMSGVQVKGRLEQGRPVLFAGDIEELKGRIVDVTITEVSPYFLVGELARHHPNLE